MAIYELPHRTRFEEPSDWRACLRRVLAGETLLPTLCDPRWDSAVEGRQADDLYRALGGTPAQERMAEAAYELLQNGTPEEIAKLKHFGAPWGDVVVVENAGGKNYAAIVELRYRMLREPLGISRTEMKLDGDADCFYVVALRQEKVIGTVALYLPEQRLRQMAVAPQVQRSGIGRRLVTRLEREALTRHISRIVLHARMPARSFYEKLGYAGEGNVFTEVGIPHILMSKTLS